MRNRKQEIKETVLMLIALLLLVATAGGTIYAQVKEPQVRINIEHNNFCYTQEEAVHIIENTLNKSDHAQLTIKFCVEKGD